MVLSLLFFQAMLGNSLNMNNWKCGKPPISHLFLAIAMRGK